MCDSSGSRPSARRRGREPLALLEHRRRVGLRRPAQRPRASAPSEYRRRRLACVELVGDLVGGERVADARACEREQLRERAQDDHLVAVDEWQRGLAAVLEVRLVDDERARVGQIVERARRVVRPAAKVSTGSTSPISAPASCAAIAIQRVRRRLRDRRSRRRAPRTLARRAGSGRLRRRRATTLRGSTPA